MKVTVTKSFFYQILFAICIAVPYLNNYELTFGVWSISALITIQKKYSFDIIKQLLCFIGILAIAIIVHFFKEYQLYYEIRDITYVIKPILGILIGYQLCNKNFQKTFQTFVYTGLFIAIIHLIILIIAVVVHNARTVNDLRFYGGYFSDFEIYALIILVFHKNFYLEYSKKDLILFTSIIGLSAFLYLARTNFIQFVILFLALKGYFKITKKSLTVLASVIFISLIGYSAILYINPKRNGQGIEALLYKIKIAPIEPFKTRINRDNWREFHDNYRSYENILTVRQMKSEGTSTVLFGKGIGSRIDLRQEVYLGDMKLRYISILHNGFMTVFLKSGLLGLLIYLLSIYLLFKKVKSQIPIVNSINLLMVGTGVFLLFSNWVFMGVYNLLDNKSILIGLFICYREIITRNNHQLQIKND